MDLWTISYVLLWVVVLVMGAILVILLRTFGSFYLSTTEGVSRDGLAIGSEAPDFEGNLISGARIGLQAYRGRWLAMLFAAPVCDDCYRMLPSIGQLREELGGVAEIVMMFQGDLADAQAMPGLAESPIPVVAIGRKGIAETYRVRVSPFVQILDEEGIVRAKGLVNHRESLEHFLVDAGLPHPVIERHRLEAANEGATHNG